MGFLTWSIRCGAAVMLIGAGVLAFYARPPSEPALKDQAAIAADCAAPAPFAAFAATVATPCAAGTERGWAMPLVYGSLYMAGIGLGLLGLAQFPARIAERRRDDDELREGVLRLLG